MNPLFATHSLSNSARFRHLAIALSVFYLLYNLTTLYSVSLYKLSPAKIHNLSTPFDDVIPFIPVMIVPYSWSFILFVASFFLVRTSAQLSQLSRRLILATVFACFIFYCYPARFSSHRSISDDWAQFGYQFLQLVDKPFNQLPSLHVSYAILLGVSLWDVIAFKKTWLLNGYRLLLISICALIVISTVFTYQHHLLDIVGGVVLAVWVLILANLIRNALVTKYLTIGVVGFLLIAVAGFYLANGSATELYIIEDLAIAIAIYWLISFTLLALAYQQARQVGDKRWFQKNSSGKLTLSTWVKFAPIIIIYNAMSLSTQWYGKWLLKVKGVEVATLKLYAIDDIVFVIATPRLIRANLDSQLIYWLFNISSSNSLTHPAILPPVIRYQVIVVDLAAEMSSHFEKCKEVYKGIVNTYLSAIHTNALPIFHCHYLYLPLLDLQPLDDILLEDYIDLFKQLDALMDAIEPQDAEANEKNEIEERAHKITLINFHCVMGLSRSIGVQILYLLYCGELTAQNYRFWIERYYPHAHLKETYLPQSLVEAIVNYRDNDMS